MKCVILAGGLGTRLAEETVVRPKPMVEIGGHPILWHIMKIYSRHGINDFVICLGYKGYMIKEFFANYCLHMSNVTFHIKEGTVETHNNYAEPWRVTCVDTGDYSMTGGRVKQIQKYIGNETFCLTYGDGVSDIDITKEIEFHKSRGQKATLAAVQPPGRWGHLDMEGDKVLTFAEKKQEDAGWINGGFFVMEPEVFDLIEGDNTVLEQGPLETLARLGKLSVFKHRGFWRPMDTLRDKMTLQEMWDKGEAPWKVW